MDLRARVPQVGSLGRCGGGGGGDRVYWLEACSSSRYLAMDLWAVPQIGSLPMVGGVGEGVIEATDLRLVRAVGTSRWTCGGEGGELGSGVARGQVGRGMIQWTDLRLVSALGTSQWTSGRGSPSSGERWGVIECTDLRLVRAPYTSRWTSGRGFPRSDPGPPPGWSALHRNGHRICPCSPGPVRQSVRVFS